MTNNLGVGIVIFLLGANSALLGLIYRSLIFRINKLEDEVTTLFRGVIAMAALLDPEKSDRVFAVFNIPVNPSPREK